MIVRQDALEFLRDQPDDSAHLILTDPPYFGIVEEDWDNAWKTEGEFLDWLGEVLDECRRVLHPRGTLALWCSPRRAWAVEGVIRDRFSVLTHLVWSKPTIGSLGRQKKDELRTFWPHSERLIVAEHGDGHLAAQHAHYEAARIAFAPIREELVRLRDLAKMTNKDVDALIGTAGMAGHYFGESQWTLPTREKWEAMAAEFRRRGVSHEWLGNDGFNSLEDGYEVLRSGYEALRAEYEARLRRFNSGGLDDWRHLTDVWEFPVPPPGPDRHPCEKPVEMLRKFIRIATDPGDVVLDCFSGSGSTAEAAITEGREFVGCDADPRWVAVANRRIGGVVPEEALEELGAFQAALF